MKHTQQQATLKQLVPGIFAHALMAHSFVYRQDGFELSLWLMAQNYKIFPTKDDSNVHPFTKFVVYHRNVK